MEEEADDVFVCVLHIHVSAYVQIVQILHCIIRATRSLHCALFTYWVGNDSSIRMLVLRMPKIIP